MEASRGKQKRDGAMAQELNSISFLFSYLIQKGVVLSDEKVSPVSVRDDFLIIFFSILFAIRRLKKDGRKANA